MGHKNPFEMLLDDDNDENLIFKDADGNPIEFEQVALIPIGDERYAILHPVNMGYEEDEVVVYSILIEANSYELLEVTDLDTLDQVNEEYMKLLKKHNK